MLQRGARRDFIAVTSSVAVLGLGVGSTLPLTALFLTARGAGPQLVGWMVAATACGGVAGTLAAPTLTLRFGRRNVMLCCVTVAGIAVMALQYTDALPAWFCLRTLFGICMAPLFVLGEAWINTLATDSVRGRVIAIYTTSFTLCQVLGPVFADIVGRFAERAFLLAGAVFFLCLPGIALARDVAAPGMPPGDAAALKDGAASWLAIARLAPTLVLGAALFAAFDNIMLSFLPLFAMDHGFSRSGALRSLTFVLIGDATLQFAAGWLADKLGRVRVQRWSGVALCILLPLLPAMITIPGIWELYLYILGGIAGSIYTLSLVSSGELFRGAALIRASGLIALTWNIASSAGPAATGISMQWLGSSSLTAVLWSMALAFVCAVRFERRRAAFT